MWFERSLNGRMRIRNGIVRRKVVIISRIGFVWSRKGNVTVGRKWRGRWAFIVWWVEQRGIEVIDDCGKNVDVDCRRREG